MNTSQPTDLARSTAEFYSDICATAYQSVKCEIEDSVFDLLPDNGLSSVVVVAGIYVNGKIGIRLEASYVLSAGAVHGLLTVEHSSFHVKLAGESAPLFHYDFVGTARSEVPSAHINIHVSDTPLLRLMANAGNKNRAKKREKRAARGHQSQPSELHFPVGGRRFRPCLEDIIQFLVLELGVDRQDDCFDVLKQGRQSWRERQVAAAVSDNPLAALRELQRMGILEEGDVGKMIGVLPQKRLNRITEY